MAQMHNLKYHKINYNIEIFNKIINKKLLKIMKRNLKNIMIQMKKLRSNKMYKKAELQTKHLNRI